MSKKENLKNALSAQESELAKTKELQVKFSKNQMIDQLVSKIEKNISVLKSELGIKD